MKPTDRQWFLDELTPLTPPGYVLKVSGTAIVLEPTRPHDMGERWYIDCPSYLGSTGRHQVGRIEQAPGWKDGIVCWMEQGQRFDYVKGWRPKLLAEFKRLALGMDQ